MRDNIIAINQTRSWKESIRLTKFGSKFLLIFFFILILILFYFLFLELGLEFSVTSQSHNHTSVIPDDMVTVIITESCRYIKYGRRFEKQCHTIYVIHVDLMANIQS